MSSDIITKLETTKRLTITHLVNRVDKISDRIRELTIAKISDLDHYSPHNSDNYSDDEWVDNLLTLSDMNKELDKLKEEKEKITVLLDRILDGEDPVLVMLTR
jgi:predicted class III extradiol MEMO1 family dioxygenase